MDQRIETERPQRTLTVPRSLARGTRAPWWLKLGVKLGLTAIGLHGARARARVPGRRGIAGEGGPLFDAPQAWIERAAALTGRRPRTLLEIGPEGMVVRAPVLAGLGLRRIWFADGADGAPRAAAPYQAVAALARSRGLPAPDLAGCADRGSALARCGAALLLGGPAALAAIPDGSVDLVVSESVLEHVRREDLVPLLQQLRRITAPDGIGLHGVDFTDHLCGGLQHLRFSDGFWASPLVGRSGIYLNRLGLSAVTGRLRRAGFEVTVAEAVVWDGRPRGPARAHPEATRPAADDRVARATLEIRPAP